ncbi:ATP-binding cassette domain-containing protein [Flavobacteriaceae bacterium AU392]|nr:phosphate ABC transporter ATP-binding protein [Flavobacteriaceae bacterium]RKM84617.1 ATP-binding cassette domain-containing protein [Flavobacteriaceae bacterium AU392]
MSDQALKIIRHKNAAKEEISISIDGFHVWIKDTHILKNINLEIPKNKITCIIGPSGSGKSTLIRSLNRINDDVSGLHTQGNIKINDSSINTHSVDTAMLRSQVGMVFQRPCVFPKSISENVVFGIQHAKKLSKSEKSQIVEDNLKAVSLWREVSHRLDDKAMSLSIGQQQRLCIARTLALTPEVILLDEPTASLDPVSSRAIEDMMLGLKSQYTLVFVTHNIQQAQRIADHLVFICEGKVIESGSASKLFNSPSDPKTKAYLNDEYCDC